MRYALDLNYLGSNYSGWQIQPNAKSIQETLEKAISTVLRTDTSVVASGRTDAGVHAFQQIIHFDSQVKLDGSIFSKINRLLPKDISLKNFAEVNFEFHARFDAFRRAYIYKIHQQKNPFVQGQSYLFRKPIDVNRMNEACLYLMGKQDFKSFSKVKTDVNTFFCEIFEAKFVQSEGEIEFHVCANRFLRGMVRALVGTLLEIGEGAQEKTWVKEIIEQKDRRVAGRNVPPEGLFLSQVLYEQEINWQKIT